MKVSFIIPVYKVEKFIHQCVRSICAQTYCNLEVILVDDGSPDECPQICDALAATDKRIRVIHKQNGGLSSARNVGIQAATGDYIVFVDGDDYWISENALKKLIEEVSKRPECDFIGYNCCYYYTQSERYEKWVLYSEELNNIIDKNLAMEKLVSSGTFPMSACLKILNRNFLINNNLFFIEGLMGEDIPWFINVLDKCKKCSFVNLYIYAYRQNVQGSITNSGGEKNFNDLLSIVEKETTLISKRSFTIKAKDSLKSFLAYELCILLKQKKISKANKDRIKNLTWLLDYDMNPKVRKVKKMKGIVGFYLTVKLLKLYNYYRLHKA